MRLFRTLLAASIGAGLLTSPALADRPRDQDRAFEATREGRSMPLPMIERRVMPHMGGADYLGPEFRGGNWPEAGLKASLGRRLPAPRGSGGSPPASPA